MSEVQNVTQAKEYVIERLERIKNLASTANAVAEKFQLYPDMPSKVLDLSCLCDDLIGELDEEA